MIQDLTNFVLNFFVLANLIKINQDLVILFFKFKSDMIIYNSF